MAGCPKRPPEPVIEEGPPQPPAPVLVRAFDELLPSLYPEMVVEPEGVVLLADLAQAHDVDRWTSTRTVWGTQPVIEFRDVDRPHTAISATAGWFLGPDDAEGRETVEAVVVRDFVASPVGESAEALLAGIAETWPPPWTLCVPSARDREGQVVAHDAERGLKLLLRPVEGNGGWIVDNVEFMSTSVVLEQWWRAKRYESCDDLGTILENGRFRPARSSRD